ncbi:MAG: CcdB family protein [Gammaproteobacteria bacterium]
MPQFDVYRYKEAPNVPYLLDVQADLLSNLATRIVIPLMLATKIKTPIKNLNLEFEIENKRVIMSTAEMAGVSVKLLGKKVMSLQSRRNEIISAIDFLITGF